MPQNSIHVAIIGGGLGGATLAWALSQLNNITFTVYEAGSEFKEQGAAVGLSRNAANALQLIGLDWDQLCKDTGAITVRTSQLIIDNGPYTGRVGFNLGGEGDQMMFSRALLLDWIVKRVPQLNMQPNKKLDRIEERSFTRDSDQKPLKLFFKDGTTAAADAVIGCDGIHSKVRKAVLGETHPAADPEFAGFWECKRMVPYEKAQEFIGKDILNPANRIDYGWSGYGGYMMVLSFNDNTMAAVYACGSSNEAADPSKWSKSVPSSEIRKQLEASHQRCRGLIDCLLEEPEITVDTHWDSPAAPTYCTDRICLMGDAAHAPVPWISAGAGMTMEDVLVLSKLLGKVKSPRDIPTAFKAYDSVVRPRTQTIVQYGREIGVALMGQNPKLDLVPHKLAQEVPAMFAYVRDVDLKTHADQALARFEVFSRQTNATSSGDSWRKLSSRLTSLRGNLNIRLKVGRHFQHVTSKSLAAQA